MNPAKIQLSASEMELVTNAGWILTKNGIIEKTKLLLAGLSEKYAALLNSDKHSLPSELFEAGPKISKGENYKGLPYLILDQPRYFDKENVFAIRTMFWWGHFFSITLHLSGKFKSGYQPSFINARNKLSATEFYSCIHESPWEHDFESHNYKRISDFDEKGWQEHVTDSPFLKIAGKLPLAEWDQASEKLLQMFLEMLQWIRHDQLPSR
jgi:hypothetical protein